MNNAVTPAVLLKDYRPSDFLIDETRLNFQLSEAATTGNERLMVRRNPLGDPSAELVFNGSGLNTVRWLINGSPSPAMNTRLGFFPYP